MERELTEWYPAHIKPLMIGVYLTRRTSQSSDFDWYAMWDGKYWMMDDQTSDLAGKRSSISYFQDRVWRGLKHAPGR